MAADAPAEVLSQSLNTADILKAGAAGAALIAIVTTGGAGAALGAGAGAGAGA